MYALVQRRFCPASFSCNVGPANEDERMWAQARQPLAVLLIFLAVPAFGAVPRKTSGFTGLLGPDKSGQGWSQCWGYGKDNAASWSSATTACGSFTHVIFAGERCDGVWVEMQMILKQPLSKYMEGGGLTSPQTGIEVMNIYNMEWTSDWWVLTKGGWTDGSDNTARCWEPNMAGAVRCEL